MHTKFFTNTDDPTENDLATELIWLLEDCVCDFRQQSRLFNSSDSNEGGYVQSRATLQELDFHWQRRLQHRIPIQYITGITHWSVNTRENLLYSNVCMCM
jgi:hypothetical protein